MWDCRRLYQHAVTAQTVTGPDNRQQVEHKLSQLVFYCEGQLPFSGLMADWRHSNAVRTSAVRPAWSSQLHVHRRGCDRRESSHFRHLCVRQRCCSVTRVARMCADTAPPIRFRSWAWSLSVNVTWRKEELQTSEIRIWCIHPDGFRQIHEWMILSTAQLKLSAQSIIVSSGTGSRASCPHITKKSTLNHE